MAKLLCLRRSLLILMLLVCGAGCADVAAGTVASDGQVQVHYVTGRVGRVTFISGNNSKQVSDKDLLQIQIWVENLSDSAKLEYKGWGGEGLSSGQKARLKDDLGNEYKAVGSGILQKPVGQKSNESLYPGSSIQDVLVFEAPVAKAQVMHLILPRSAYSQNSNGPRFLELAIPTSTFNGGDL